MPEEPEAGHGIPFREAVQVWLRVAALSFGGPAAQIAVMHRILVEEKKWIGETRFLHALNYCMLLPGPEAQQLATYIGWLLHRVRGGVVAGVLFVLPGYLALMALSCLYVAYGEVGVVQGLFFGLRAAVLAVVVEALNRVARRALRNPTLVGIAIVAFIALFLFAVPFPVVVIGAAASGWIGYRLGLAAFNPADMGGGVAGPGHEAAFDRAFARHIPDHVRPSGRRAVRIALVCLGLWLGPVLLLLVILGPGNVFTAIGLFFSETAVITFGGAYAVLAYVAQQGVAHYGWLKPSEMLTGLGLAETTPGPLVIVLQFVGFMGAYRQAGGLPPMVAGILGGTLATWTTFAPCFLWILVGGPYIEALRNNRALSAALSAVTAAVVGVIANLGLWFGVHTLFGRVGEPAPGSTLHMPIPDFATLDVAALLLGGGAIIALMRYQAPLLAVLAVCSLLGVAIQVLGLP